MTFEDSVRDTLNEALAVPGIIDAAPEAGALIRSAALRARRNRRLVSLSGVGAVVAVVAGILVWTAGGQSGGTTPVAPTTPTPTPSTTPSTLPSTAPSASAGSAAPSSVPPSGPATVTVALAGAQLTLPAGWVAEPLAPPPHTLPVSNIWCLMPQAGPAPSSQDSPSCAITFAAPALGRSGLSVDTPGGYVSNPEFCGAGQDASDQLLAYRDSQLGDRPADYRQWLFVCKDGTRWPVEQYVADNSPSFILYSSHADATVHDVMTTVAATAQLPGITAPLRLSEFGIIRTLSGYAGGYHVAVDRVVQGIPGLINNNPETYSYDVPERLLTPQDNPKIGDLVQLNTDGTAVTSFFVLPGAG